MPRPSSIHRKDPDMVYAVIAYLHFVAILLLFALLVIEHQLMLQPLDFTRARGLYRTDIAFGIVAGLVLFTGAARAMHFGKGLDYYLNNSFFHAKVALFIVVGLLSLYPTLDRKSTRLNSSHVKISYAVVCLK